MVNPKGKKLNNNFWKLQGSGKTKENCCKGRKQTLSGRHLKQEKPQEMSSTNATGKPNKNAAGTDQNMLKYLVLEQTPGQSFKGRLLVIGDWLQLGKVYCTGEPNESGKEGERRKNKAPELKETQDHDTQ